MSLYAIKNGSLSEVYIVRRPKEEVEKNYTVALVEYCIAIWVRRRSCDYLIVRKILNVDVVVEYFIDQSSSSWPLLAGHLLLDNKRHLAQELGPFDCRAERGDRDFLRELEARPGSSISAQPLLVAF